MNRVQTVALFLAFISLNAAEDYCKADLCRYGTHIACGHSGKFDSTCPRNAALVYINQSLRDHIVATFNEKRNFIAGGGDTQHYPACRMATMEWDDELAMLAELNVKQCQMKHDSCRNTKRFPISGQNLARIPFFDKPTIQSLVDGAIQMWYNEIRDSNMKYIRSYEQHVHNAVIGHYTAMVADRNYRLGCSAAIYTKPGNKYSEFLFVCNFAFTNVVEQPIYTDCHRAAVNCTTGSNPMYPNLCSPLEEYKVSFF
ncbi:venom allergen-1-like [Musca autumnalis]|uniref:venom allergen-1-like n=1 Tax=Musca autumnalis TaxID=221902 RepID=UPI003CE9CAAE